jgi:hypothetical protein
VEQRELSVPSDVLCVIIVLTVDRFDGDNQTGRRRHQCEELGPGIDGQYVSNIQ